MIVYNKINNTIFVEDTEQRISVSFYLEREGPSYEREHIKTEIGSLISRSEVERGSADLFKFSETFLRGEEHEKNLIKFVEKVVKALKEATTKVIYGEDYLGVVSERVEKPFVNISEVHLKMVEVFREFARYDEE